MTLRSVAVALTLPLILNACGTPQEQCIRANTKEFQLVDSLLAETQANLARGYGYEEHTVTDWGWGPCFYGASMRGGYGYNRYDSGMCWEPYQRNVRRAVTIDPAVEQRKLAALTVRRKQLVAHTQAVIAACKAEHPE